MTLDYIEEAAEQVGRKSAKTHIFTDNVSEKLAYCRRTFIGQVMLGLLVGIRKIEKRVFMSINVSQVVCIRIIERVTSCFSNVRLLEGIMRGTPCCIFTITPELSTKEEIFFDLY